MKIAFYGSSLLSSYWNGAATYYRGLLQALSKSGHDITFFEPDVHDRQQHRDIDPPEWCRVVVYEPTTEALCLVTTEAARADVVIKASGVGFLDDVLLEHVLNAAHPRALKIFWDVDAPATLAELRADPDHPMHPQIPRLDLVLTYGGGDPVVNAYRDLGAARCVPIYNALDPETHFPVGADARFSCDLAFLGNRLPDREARVDEFFFKTAAALPSRQFLLCGSGWADKAMPPNVRYLGHLPTRDHNPFNATPKAILNISRESMASNGFSPATRVFEAAGAGACLITDAWEGLDLFLTDGEEVLAARDGREVAEILQALTPARAREIGQRARARVLREHTYAHRAREVNHILAEGARKRSMEAAR